MLRTTEGPCGGLRYIWGVDMDRVAIFVDAGYLFAAGSTALTGSKKSRQQLVLKKSATIAKLKEFSAEKAKNTDLLRVYWYDGASGYKGLTSEQADLAYKDDVKVRLGFINSHGQQKGVDSLIVTDLIELARNRSICDAVLMSGDEDVRVGVQMAQNFGVRVHLLGIEPCRSNQSNLLLQEADTCSEWSKSEIEGILKYNSPVPLADTPSTSENLPTDADKISAVVTDYIVSLEVEKTEEIRTYIQSNNSIPPEHDGKALAMCRDAIGRNLESEEKRKMRMLFQLEFRNK